MKSSLIQKEVLPFIVMFGSLIGATILTDLLLHLSNHTWVGRWLGIPGVFLIFLSFAYSLRKRKLIQFGSPRGMLVFHEVLAWIGVLLILVHAGIHIYTILPWLALIAMLINVASGMTGSYLLKRSRRFLTKKKEAYSERGLSEEEVEKSIFWDAITFDVMKKWRSIHLPITLVSVALSITHIVTIFFFWSWK